MTPDDVAVPDESIEAQVAQIWCEVLGVERVESSDNFFELGGQSLQAVAVFAEIDNRLSVRLPLASLFKAPTVQQLADLVRSAEGAESWSSLVPIRAEGSKHPLFLISGLNLLLYRDLVRLLGPEQPAYGLQALGLDGTSPPFTLVEEQAAHYIRQIRTIQPTGPFLLGGGSAHGMIALEMAQQLRAEGIEDVLVIFIDTLAPDYYHEHRRRGVATPGYLAQRARQVIDNQAKILAALGIRGQLRYAAGKGLLLGRRYARKLKNRLFPKALDRVERVYRTARWEYRPAYYPGRVVLFRATHQRPDFAHDPRLGWGDLIGELEVHEIPGYHASILMEPRVHGLAEAVAACLDRVTNGA